MDQDFHTYQQEQETTYDPEVPLYWANSAEYYVAQSQDLPEDADYRRNNPLDEWFEKFLARRGPSRMGGRSAGSDGLTAC